AMWQAEIRVDLDAIRHNVALLRAGTTAEVMTVVKADGYGHGMVPVARAALDAGATWLGVCTLDEALALRAAGITAPVLAWLPVPGHASVDAQLDAFRDALATAARFGLNPRYRHLANSAATLTRPDSHFELVRPGIASYGLSPIAGERFGLRPAMTVRARVL